MQLSHRIHTLFACVYTQTTRGRKSASHHPSVWPAPFFSGHLSPAQDHLCRLPERGARSGGAAPRQPACLAGCLRPLPRGRGPGGGGGPTAASQTNPARPRGWCPAPRRRAPAGHPGRPPRARNDPPLPARRGRQGPQPPRALAELCPRAQGGEATRSQRTNDICPIAKAACLPLRSGSGVPTKRVYRGTIYFRRRNANWGTVLATAVSTWKNSLWQHPGHLQRKHHSLRFENPKPHALFIILSFIESKEKKNHPAFNPWSLYINPERQKVSMHWRPDNLQVYNSTEHFQMLQQGGKDSVFP